MSSKRDRGDELAADSVHTLRHVKRLQVQVEKDINEKKLTPKELGYEDVSAFANEFKRILLTTAWVLQVFQVAEMTSVDVADVIERIGLKAMNQIMSGKGISFSLPNRTGTRPTFKCPDNDQP
jgi:phosphate-selective porin